MAPETARFERPQPERGTEGDAVWRRAVTVIIGVALVGIVVALVTDREQRPDTVVVRAR